MTFPTSLNVALKEWAIVTNALATGRQTILLRKGGIYESSGEFEVEHREFLLFPTYLHQKRDMVKEADREGFEQRSDEPAQVTFTTAAVVTDIIQLRDRAQMDAIDSTHIWTPSLIDMRFNYRPENPLYLLIVRACRLPRPDAIENTIEYAGCKSWVPLGMEISTAGALPVLDDVRFQHHRDAILEKIR
jgi:hypothetical protein